MLLSLPYLTIWDVIKQNLLDKRKTLTLDMMTTKLIAVTNQTEWDCQAKKTEKKAKAEQLALFAKLESLDAEDFSGENKKRLKKNQNLQINIIHAIRRNTKVITV